MIASLIEKYQEKMQSYLSIKEINEFIMPFIVIPLFFNYNSKFFHNKRQLDNFFANIRISRGINA